MKLKKKIIILVILNLVLVLGQLVVSAARATDGTRLSQVVAETNLVERENHQLRSQIYAFSSLEEIQKRAQVLNLSRVTAQFVNVTTAVASAQ